MIDNRSESTVQLVDIENRGAPGSGAAVGPGSGTWTGLGDVEGQIGNPGVVVAVAAAGAGPGMSQFMFATADGGLWHTIRQANGTWTGLGNVKGQIGDPGAISAVTAASSAAGQAQFLFA